MGIRGKDYTLLFALRLCCFTCVCVCVCVCQNYNRGLFPLKIVPSLLLSGNGRVSSVVSSIHFAYIFVCECDYTRCERVCVSVRMCWNNYYTICFALLYSRKFGLSSARWQTGNSSKLGQKLGRPLNYYDFACVCLIACFRLIETFLFTCGFCFCFSHN